MICWVQFGYSSFETILTRCKKHQNDTVLILDNIRLTRKIKPDAASLNNGQKCRNPVFMRVSGIGFIKWLYFGSICELSNGKFFMV